MNIQDYMKSAIHLIHSVRSQQGDDNFTYDEVVDTALLTSIAMLQTYHQELSAQLTKHGIVLDDIMDGEGEFTFPKDELLL